MRWMLTSKIHRATVTGADLDYVGSITIVLPGANGKIFAECAYTENT